MKNIDINLENIKFKTLSLDRLTISFDRLTRFKDYEIKYKRVFKDILSEALIIPKLRKTDMDALEYSVLTKLAALIINSSLEKLSKVRITNSQIINSRLKTYETGIFNADLDAIQLLDNDINYSAFINMLPKNIPSNLKWLKLLELPEYTRNMSYTLGYGFPVSKVIICEGLTEEILLPEFAKLLNYDFDKNGVHIISAGGKNQVVKLFYEMVDRLTIPVFVLMDKDAEINKKEIIKKLRPKDKIYLLESGEFEDTLPISLIEKSLKYSIANISEEPSEHDNIDSGMVNYLENFYKNRGTHEFKKSDFARTVKANISGIEDVPEEIRFVIDELKKI